MPKRDTNERNDQQLGLLVLKEIPRIVRILERIPDSEYRVRLVRAALTLAKPPV